MHYPLPKRITKSAPLIQENGQVNLTYLHASIGTLDQLPRPMFHFGFFINVMIKIELHDAVPRDFTSTYL